MPVKRKSLVIELERKGLVLATERSWEFPGGEKDKRLEAAKRIAGLLRLTMRAADIGPGLSSQMDVFQSASNLPERPEDQIPFITFIRHHSDTADQEEVDERIDELLEEVNAQLETADPKYPYRMPYEIGDTIG